MPGKKSKEPAAQTDNGASQTAENPAPSTDADVSQSQPASAQPEAETETGEKKPSVQQRQPDPGKMIIKVYSPYQVYFDDQAASISAVNDTGPFDILARHHRFLTLLSPCELVINADKGEEKIKISRGIMYVKEDRVTVFLDV